MWTASLLIAVVVVVLAPAAQAALFLVFETNSYRPAAYQIPRTGGIGSPGEVVRAQTGGRGAVGPGEVMPAFLASSSYPSKVGSAGELVGMDGLTPIGELRANDDGNGRLSFETPALASGEYEIVLYCRSCAATSNGDNVVSVAPFRITGSRTESPTSFPPWIAVLIVLGLAVTSFFVRRRSSRDTVGQDGTPP